MMMHSVFRIWAQNANHQKIKTPKALVRFLARNSIFLIALTFHITHLSSSSMLGPIFLNFLREGCGIRLPSSPSLKLCLRVLWTSGRLGYIYIERDGYWESPDWEQGDFAPKKRGGGGREAELLILNTLWFPVIKKKSRSVSSKVIFK